MPDHGGDDLPPRPWTRALADAWRGLFVLRPAPFPRRWLALQAAIAIAVPIAVMSLLGRPELGYQAATGSFTALYVSHLGVRRRARILPFVALGLVAAGAAGVAVAPSPLLIAIGLVLVAVAASGIVYGFGLGPPGPLFFVLVYGVSAHIAASGSLTGPGAGGYLLTLATGCVFAYLVVITPLVLPRVRRAFDPAPRIAWMVGRSSTASVLWIRASAVALVGTVIGALLDPGHAYWIVASGIAVVGVSVRRSTAVSRALHRMVGTILGAALYLAIGPLAPTGLWLALILGVMQFVIEVFVVRNYALALVFITPLVLLLTGAATGIGMSPQIAALRVVDTVVGAMIGAATILLSAREPHTREST